MTDFFRKIIGVGFCRFLSVPSLYLSQLSPSLNYGILPMANGGVLRFFLEGGGAPGPETLPNLFDIRFCIRSKNRNILLVFCSSPHTTNCLVSYPGNIYNLKKKELLKECGYPAVLPQVPDSAYHFHLIHDEGGETCTIHLQPLHFD